MTKEEFHSECDKMEGVFSKFESYVIVVEGEEERNVQVHGTGVKLVSMLQALYRTVRDYLVEDHSEEFADHMMRVVTMTDDEINAEIKVELKNLLKKIMDDSREEKKEGENDGE